MIELNDFKRMWNIHGADISQIVSKVGESGWYILGEAVKKFENELAQYTGHKHVIGVANGLSAIELALRALEIKPGEKVLTTPLSAYATSLAIQKVGGVPVFCDVDDRGLIDFDLAKKILQKDSEIRYFIPVHLYGQKISRKKIQSLQTQFPIKVIDDAAQSLGASFGDEGHAYSGEVIATSFYPTKNLGALGDGGAVFTNDEHIAKKLRALRDYGSSAKYVHDFIGDNSRLDEMQAAILSYQLTHLDEYNRSRREIATRYLNEIRNPFLSCFIPNSKQWNAHLFPVRLTNPSSREHFQSWMSKNNIRTAIHYPILIPYQKAMISYPHQIAGSLKVAKDLSDSLMSIPIHPLLSEEEVDQVIQACNAFRPEGKI